MRRKEFPWPSSEVLPKGGSTAAYLCFSISALISSGGRRKSILGACNTYRKGRFATGIWKPLERVLMRLCNIQIYYKVKQGLITAATASQGVTVLGMSSLNTHRTLWVGTTDILEPSCACLYPLNNSSTSHLLSVVCDKVFLCSQC